MILQVTISAKNKALGWICPRLRIEHQHLVGASPTLSACFWISWSPFEALDIPGVPAVRRHNPYLAPLLASGVNV